MNTTIPIKSTIRIIEPCIKFNAACPHPVYVTETHRVAITSIIPINNLNNPFTTSICMTP